MNNFPNPILLENLNEIGVSPNSWAPLLYQYENEKIVKYRLLSLVEEATCYFTLNNKKSKIMFKKCSLLTLNVKKILSSRNPKTSFSTSMYSSSPKSYDLLYYQSSILKFDDDVGDSLDQLNITDFPHY